MFDEICNSSWFVKTSIILFLNKSDLFRVSACRFFLRVVCLFLFGFLVHRCRLCGCAGENRTQSAADRLLSILHRFAAATAGFFFFFFFCRSTAGRRIGALNYDEALRFVRNEFLQVTKRREQARARRDRRARRTHGAIRQRNRDAKKNVYPHVTCGERRGVRGVRPRAERACGAATDTENVKVVFGAIADTVIKEMMDGSLLM